VKSASGRSRIRVAKAALISRLVPDIDELRNLTEYANRYHHDTNPAYQTQHINDTELLDFTRRTLVFAKR
jgi:hypothetical protein